MANHGFQKMMRRLKDGSIKPEEAIWLNHSSPRHDVTWKLGIALPIGVLVCGVEDQDGNSEYDHYLPNGDYEAVTGYSVLRSWQNELGEIVNLRAGRVAHITDRHTGAPNQPSQFVPDISASDAVSLFMQRFSKSLPHGRQVALESVELTQAVGWNSRSPIDELIEAGVVSSRDWAAALALKDTVFDINASADSAERRVKAYQLSRQIGSGTVRLMTRGNKSAKIVPIIKTGTVPQTNHLSVALAVSGSHDRHATVLTAFPGRETTPMPFAEMFNDDQVRANYGGLTLAQIVLRSTHGQSLTADQSDISDLFRAAHESAWAEPLLGAVEVP